MPAPSQGVVAPHFSATTYWLSFARVGLLLVGGGFVLWRMFSFNRASATGSTTGWVGTDGRPDGRSGHPWLAFLIPAAVGVLIAIISTGPGREANIGGGLWAELGIVLG